MFEATLLLLGGSADLSRWVGALKAVEEAEVVVPRIVASSTASPVAAFVACGYTNQEIQESWNEFKVGIRNRRIGANEIEEWVRSLLSSKGVETFGDLKNMGKPELKLLVQDVDDPTALILPDDALKLGFQPDELSVVTSVRASMAIPDVPIFEPISIGTHRVAGCYWRTADESFTLDQIVAPRTAALSFYSEPIVGAETLLRRVFSRTSRGILDVDRKISESQLVRDVRTTLASKLNNRMISHGDADVIGLPKTSRFINLKNQPAWFSLDFDEVLDAATAEAKRGLSNLDISFEPEVEAEKAIYHQRSKGETDLVAVNVDDQDHVTDERHINAWIVDGEPPLEKGHAYQFAINVGRLCEHTLAAPKLKGIDWNDNEDLKVLIVLSGYGFSVHPRQHDFTLPKQGDTDPIFFAITPTKSATLLLRISLYLAREFTLLQEFEIPIAIIESVRAA